MSSTMSINHDRSLTAIFDPHVVSELKFMMFID